MLKNISKKGFLLVKIDFAFLPTTFIVYRALVHCRVGSLENPQLQIHVPRFVHCRVGSLEIIPLGKTRYTTVHCRVGSLENCVSFVNSIIPVHCRVGRLKLAKIITPEIHQTRKV